MGLPSLSERNPLNLSKTARKAIAAFIIPLLGLPLGAWITGEQPFSAGVIVSAVVVGLTAAIGVYYAPNEPAA